MKQMEYGGFLPLELNKGDDYFYGYDKNVCRLNSGRNAIIAAFLDAGAKKIYLPRYNCEFVREAIRKFGFEIELYSLDDNMEPIISTFNDDDWLLYPSYFGIFSRDKILNVVNKYKNVVLDNTQDFFLDPVMNKNVYNVYSCRKFIGVCDGAYIIHDGGIKKEYPQSESSEHANYLIKSYEFGTNSCYNEYLRSEDVLTELPIQTMSKLTYGILCNTNYEEIKSIRNRNFVALNDKLGHINKIKINNFLQSPMIYPFYFEDDGLRNHLIVNKIYVPQWWKYLLKEAESCTLEAKYTKWLFALPIDQRYTEKDMNDIANVILDYVKKDKTC